MEQAQLKPWQRVLIGVAHDPRVVALARSFAYLVVPPLIDAVILWLGGPGVPSWLLVVAPGLAAFLRILEGYIDQYFKGSDANSKPLLASAQRGKR